MSMLRQWQIVLLLIAIFVVGAVSGALLTVRAVKRAATSRGQTNLVNVAVKYYERQLSLTPDQVKQLEPVIKQTAQEVSQEISQSRRSVFASFQRMQGEMEKVLTPEQLKKFEEIRARARARIRSQVEGATKPSPSETRQ